MPSTVAGRWLGDTAADLQKSPRECYFFSVGELETAKELFRISASPASPFFPGVEPFEQAIVASSGKNPPPMKAAISLKKKKTLLKSASCGIL